MSTAAIDLASDFLLDAASDTIIVSDDAVAVASDAAGSTQASQWVFELVDPSGTLLADLSPLCKARHFTVRRNRAEQVDISLDQGQLETLCTTLGTTVRGLLAPGVNEIRIKRGNRFLVGAQISYFQASLETDSRTIDVRAVGFLDLFKDRYVRETFTNAYPATDLGQVAWNFIDQTQSLPNGDFGVTLGANTQTSHTTDSSDVWQPYATSIRDIIIALTQRLNSFDFEFTYDKQFNYYWPGIGQLKSELRFGYPGNIKSLKLPIDASELVNYAVERGSGNGDQQQITTPEDTASQATYKVREAIDDQPSINVPATLTEKGNEVLRKSANPTAIPEIVLDGNQEPYLGAYWIGDSVPLAIDSTAGSAFASLNGQTVRIDEIDVTIDQNDSETITLKVGTS